MITVGGETFGTYTVFITAFQYPLAGTMLTLNTDTGANASAEEAEEGVEDTSQKVIDVVHSFRLQNIPFDKKQYLGLFKSLSQP